MKRFLDFYIRWAEACIMALNNARIVTKPFRDFVKRHTGRRKQACKSMPHRVRCYPREALCGSVLIERAGEIVSVTVFSVSYIGTKHVGVARPITFQELTKRLCKWNRAFFPVFKVDRSSFAQVQRNATAVTLAIIYALSFAFLFIAAKPHKAQVSTERTVNVTLDAVMWCHEQHKGKITWAELNNEVCKYMRVKRTEPWERK